MLPFKNSQPIGSSLNVGLLWRGWHRCHKSSKHTTSYCSAFIDTNETPQALPDATWEYLPRSRGHPVLFEPFPVLFRIQECRTYSTIRHESYAGSIASSSSTRGPATSTIGFLGCRFHATAQAFAF